VPYLLDGNNLVGRARGRSKPNEDDRSALVAELCDRLRRTRARVVLFFDGAAPAGAANLGTLSIRSSGRESADDVILREIARSRAPRELVLVTADRELSRRAREAGAQTLAPDEFWARFGNVAGAEPSEGRVDVAEWLRFFGDERNRR
jgi:YacP-like NYN domain